MSAVAGEPGRIDPTFNSFFGITGRDSHVYVGTIAEQPDGNVVFGGRFVEYDGFYVQPNLARAHSDGEIDLTFRPVVDGPVSEIAVHSDGSMIITGDFWSIDGQPRRKIARLYNHGGLDTSFDARTVPLYLVENIFRCADGTTVAKAWLTNGLGQLVKQVVRFNHSGTLDPTFNVVVEPSYYSNNGSTYRYENPWRLVAASPRSWGNPSGADERYYIVGGFNSVNGIARTNIARLHPNGTVDVSFDSGVIPFGYSYYGHSFNLAVQPDGRPIVWDSTNTMRLNTDGSIDGTFNAGCGFVSGGGHLYVQTDGKIVVQGTSLEGIPRNQLSRLNADGTFDWSFHPGSAGTNTTIRAGDYRVVTLLSSGKIMVGGQFTSVDGIHRRGIARLYGGDLPSGPPIILQHPASLTLREFQPMVLFSDAISFERLEIEWRRDGLPLPGETNLSIRVQHVSATNAGEYTVLFSNTVGSVTSVVAHVTVDPPATGPGSLDLQYADGMRVGENVYHITIDHNDRALVSADDATPLRRLNHDGTPDPSFRLGQIISGDGEYVYSVLVTPGEELQIGGFFQSIDGTKRHNIARLKPDGELDPNFAPSPGANHFVYDSVLDPDGKTVIVGSFSGVNGIPRAHLARLNPDGSLDLTFNSANTFSNYYFRSQIGRLPTGKYVIGGNIRINSDGTVDDSFHVGPVSGSINVALPLPNGDVLIAGSFTTVSSLPRNLIARLRATDGSVDPSFSSPPLSSLPENGIFDMALQSDGKIVIAGRFTTGTNSVITNNVARLNSGGTLDTTFTPAVVEGASKTYYFPHVSRLAVQSDGGILVGGNFLSVNGYPRTNIARLNGDRVPNPSAPAAQTGAASDITFLTATLTGAANPNDAATRVYLEYGTSTNYGSVTAFQKLPAGTNNVPIVQGISDLLSDTTYHYRLVATNRMGVTFGEDRNLTTSSRPPEPQISGHTRLGNGGIEFTFTGDTGRSYTVMMSTNLIDWSLEGTATEISMGRFKFSDGQASGPTTKFYRLRTP